MTCSFPKKGAHAGEYKVSRAHMDLCETGRLEAEAQAATARAALLLAAGGEQAGADVALGAAQAARTAGVGGMVEIAACILAFCGVPFLPEAEARETQQAPAALPSRRARRESQARRASTDLPAAARRIAGAAVAAAARTAVAALVAADRAVAQADAWAMRTADKVAVAMEPGKHARRRSWRTA